MSTVDTYVIGAVNTFYEDIIGEKLTDSPENRKKITLEQLRSIATAFSMSILFATFVNPNFETLFTYLFYSANGFVGPILFAIKGYKINAYAVTFSILFGFLYPLIDIFALNYLWIGSYPGTVPVIFSIIITKLWKK
jgi:hypothetical protein